MEARTTEVDPIESVFGPSTADYVARKNRGGRNAARGLDFETVFAISKIGELIGELISGKDDVQLSKQAKEFVDDIQILFPVSARKEDYQLKDAIKVSWSAGKAQIRKDFANQQRLNLEHHDCESTQTLVVSRSEVARRLGNSMPSKIAGHSRVELFPQFGETPNAALLTSARVRLAVAEVCCSPNESDKLEAVFGALCNAWGNVPPAKPTPLSAILHGARRINSYLRVTDAVPPLPLDVKAILDAVKGFTYDIDRGFFRWRYLKADSGILSYNCLDARFQQFLELIRRKSPRSFEDLESLLLC